MQTIGDWHHCNAKLELVTPRLTRLELSFGRNHQPLHGVNLYRSFPKSLTSFEVRNKGCSNASELASSYNPISLPSTQRSTRQGLKIRFKVPSFRTFVAICYDRLTRDPTKPTFGLPDSLSSLCVSVSCLASVIQLFIDCGLKNITLSKLKVTLMLQEGQTDRTKTLLDFDNILPRMVIDFTLDFTLHHTRSNSNLDWQVLSLPPQLTSLTLVIFSVHASLITSLESLRQLQTLDLYSHTAPIRLLGQEEAMPKPHANGLYSRLRIDPLLLPRCLTSLALASRDHVALGAGCFALLPPSLKSLTSSSFNLKLFSTFRRHLPHCHLHLTVPYDFWQSDNALRLRASKFGTPWTSTLDLSCWSAAILQQCAARGMSLTLRPESSPAPSSMEPAVDEFSADLAGDSIGRLFSWYTKFTDTLLGMPNRGS